MVVGRGYPLRRAADSKTRNLHLHLSVFCYVPRVILVYYSTKSRRTQVIYFLIVYSVK